MNTTVLFMSELTLLSKDGKPTAETIRITLEKELSDPTTSPERRIIISGQLENLAAFVDIGHGFVLRTIRMARKSLQRTP